MGLGLEEEEEEDHDIEADTNFLSKLLVNIDDDNLSEDRIFSIYINELDTYVKDHVITFGGWNIRYSKDGTTADDINWVPLVYSTGYYWVLPIKSFSIYVDNVAINNIKNKNANNNVFNNNNNENNNNNNIDAFNIVNFDYPFGVLTISSSFIALPLKEL